MSEYENVGDIIAKWEQYTKVMASKGLTSEFLFVYKKKLFFTKDKETRDPVEFDLLFHQVFSINIYCLIILVYCKCY